MLISIKERYKIEYLEWCGQIYGTSEKCRFGNFCNEDPGYLAWVNVSSALSHLSLYFSCPLKYPNTSTVRRLYGDEVNHVSPGICSVSHKSRSVIRRNVPKEMEIILGV